MAKNKHMTLEDRYVIQHGLEERKSFRQIGNDIGKDPSTVSKEILGHYEVVETGAYGRGFNPCALARGCHKAQNHCYRHCADFVEEHCPRLKKPPYVCNGCEDKPRCRLRKHMYRALFAQKEYEAVRSESRQGVGLSPEEIKRLDDIVTPLIKKGQSIHHICANNADIIMVDEKTIYNYIDLGLLSAKSIDLPRKVRYRPRRKEKQVKLDKHCYDGRTYEDFLHFVEDNPEASIVEMDTVEGVKGGKVLLTIFFRVSNFMLAFLRDANTARSVTEVIDYLYELLGAETYSQLFNVILTDRGSEFSNPKAIEYDAEGNLRSLVFYCDPSAPSQKGGVEVCHEFIRRVIPKGTSLNNFTQADIDLMMDHINSYSRKKLNNRSAHQMFSFLNYEDVLVRLNATNIEPNSINLTPGLLKK